jgi:hypothetical protein
MGLSQKVNLQSLLPASHLSVCNDVQIIKLHKSKNHSSDNGDELERELLCEVQPFLYFICPKIYKTLII